jgi:hypothetical protein
MTETPLDLFPRLAEADAPVVSLCLSGHGRNSPPECKSGADVPFRGQNLSFRAQGMV